MKLASKRWLMVLLISLPSGCRTGASVVQVSSITENRLPHCHIAGGIAGICKVAEVSGRLATATEEARRHSLGKVTKVAVKIHAKGLAGGESEIVLLEGTGDAESGKIGNANDLYHRDGCLAEVSGSDTGSGFMPKLAARLFLSAADEGRSAVMEVTDFRKSSRPVFINYDLICDWKQ